MKNSHLLRHFILLVILLCGVAWSLASARQDNTDSRYPAGRYLVTADWLNDYKSAQDLVIIDVRTDEFFDGILIPGAIRLPWSTFRYNDTAANEASVFIGATEAQNVLGAHGIGRTDTIVLYDSVAEDGGATASYLFLVLDLLGHEDKMLLDGGIDSWKRAGYELASRPRQLEPILYQAPMAEIRGRSVISGIDIYHRLGDPHYQFVDVRSPEEYVGKKGTRDLKGNGLKLGHIPTAVNIGYTNAWIDTETKHLKSYEALQSVYRGLDPDQTIIVYCNSGRRSSFSYFVLRLMGFKNVRSYEASWKEWGLPANYFPVETSAEELTGSDLPDASATQDSDTSSRQQDAAARQTPSTQDKASGDSAPQGGYISCGG